MNNLWLFLLAVLLIGSVCFSCNQSSDDDDDEMTNAECIAIGEDCEASAESACEEYQCIDSEPETPGCRIETEGYYYQTYGECAKNEGAAQCKNLPIWQNNCLAACFHAHVDADSYEQAEDECMYLCVYSVDY